MTDNELIALDTPISEDLYQYPSDIWDGRDFIFTYKVGYEMNATIVIKAKTAKEADDLLGKEVDKLGWEKFWVQDLKVTTEQERKW